MTSEKRIGLDVGGVIISKAAEKGTAEEYLQSRALPDSVSTIKLLIEAYGQNNVFIISKCPDFAESTVLEWLGRSELLAIDGLKRSNIHFCRKKRDKAPIARELKLTHFVDDRAEVLHYMKGIVPCRIQFSYVDGLNRDVEVEGLQIINSWTELGRNLLANS